MPKVKVMELEMEGVSVYVMVDSKRAEVYQRKTSSKPKETKGYIESVEGKTFSIHVETQPGLYRHAVLCIDGEWMSWGTIWSGRTGEVNFRKQRDSPTTRRPFIFAPVQLTDDTNVATTSEQIVKNIGVIKVIILRVIAMPKKRGKRNMKTASVATYTPGANKILHEQSKKATLSHVAGLGAPESVAPKSPGYDRSEKNEKYHVIDSEAKPWMTFQFKDLSHDLLEIQKIIPMSAVVVKPMSAKAEGRKRAASNVITIDSEDDSDEETPEQELARLRKENAALKRIKLEPRVKSEGTVELERKPKMESRKAIRH